jgi:hypothetical protein
MAKNMLERVQRNGQPTAERASAPARPAQAQPNRAQRRVAAADRDQFVNARKAPVLKTRKPKGVIPFPLILLEGGDYSGKSYSLGELALSERVGTVYWLPWGERVPDEYDPEVYDLEIVEHDGTWGDIIEQIEAVRAVAQAAYEAKQPPVVLGIDSMTAEWEGLTTWAHKLASKTDSGRKALNADPDADITIQVGQWNASNRRHRRLMRLLHSFPGIVVVTARGKWVSVVDEQGRPVKNQKEYRVVAQADLPFETTVHMRLSRDAHPHLVSLRSLNPKVKLIPGEDEPREMRGMTLDSLIFDVLGCSVDSVPRRVPEVSEVDHTEELARTRDWLWHLAQTAGWNAQRLAAAYQVWAESDDVEAIKAATVEALEEFGATKLGHVDGPPAPSTETVEQASDDTPADPQDEEPDHKA